MSRRRSTRRYSDYFDYREEIRKIPPHRILAINRGERAKVLRVKVECDMEAMQPDARRRVPPRRPPARRPLARLRPQCAGAADPSQPGARDSPGADRAGGIACGGGLRPNLRNLLLQPPVCDRRLLTIDPGFENGCKLAALDQFGNVLEHGLIYLIGKPERRRPRRSSWRWSSGWS